jgi:membrane fusion protein, multidrug efflux system
MMPSATRPRTCPSFIAGSFLISLGIGILLIGGACGKKETQAPPPPPIVEVVDVVQKDVPVYSEWVGSLDGLVNATIRAQVTGYLIKQNYKEGDLVKKGQVLFEIDPRTFQAALDQAKGSLAQAEARHTTAKANLNRIRPLAQKNAVSQKDLDDALGAEESSRASVQGARAAAEKAQLELDFTKITSPVDGIAGIAKAQIGNLVGPNSTQELTAVSTIDPIKCYVSISEQQYLRTMEKKTKQASKVPLSLILSDGSTYPHKGTVAFADRQVDERTGTIRVAALFPNPQNLLRPGMFSRVRAEMEVLKGALLVPQQAVIDVQGKNLVAVVGPENKVAMKPVKVGETFGQLRVIPEGLQAGEKVVSEGIQKVREGMVVNPKAAGGDVQKKAGEAQQPEAKPETKPQPKPGKR